MVNRMREHAHADDVVALTRALVAIDPRNPPGNEQAAMGACRAALEPYGAAFTEVEASPGRTSLIATIGDAGERPTLIVNGHLDVVPINEQQWTRPPFAGEIDTATGRMYGRGTADMKGGIAAAICALGVLKRAGRAPACNLVFHLVADEERGGALGTAVLVERGLVRGDACLVPEPTGLQVCVAERGMLVVEVTTKGRPAHGSQPQNGISAIEKAAKVVLALHAADMGEPPHPLLGKPTCNAGVIAGGSGHNTVAEQCVVTVDRRLLPGATRSSALTEISERISAIADGELAFEVEAGAFAEPSEMDASDPFVASVAGAV